MHKAQDAGILGIDGLRSVEPDRMMQVAAKAEGTPKMGRRRASAEISGRIPAVKRGLSHLIVAVA